MTKKKWIRNTENGDKFAITDDTIAIMGLDKDGFMWFTRVPKDRLSVITSPHSPEGTGHILGPASDDPAVLKQIEDTVVKALVPK